jgi:hypothetical protein
MLIYVAGPFSAKTEDEVSDNIGRACAAGKEILDRGHVPFIPHLTVTYDVWHEEAHGHPGDYEVYIAWDLEILRRCDALLYLASSPGADRELALARELGLPVYLSVDEIPT